MTGHGDNVGAAQLLAFIERVERMDEEIAALNDDKKEIFAEAKGNGFNVKAMKVVLQKRRMDPDKRSELEADIDLYLSALGMSVETGTENARVQAHEPAGQTVEQGGEGGAALPADQVSDAAVEKKPSRLAHNQKIAGASPAPATNSQAKTSTGNGGSNAPLDSAPVSGEASRLSDGSGTVASIRQMTMTPLEPREAGGLKGFGFTVKFDDVPAAPTAAANALKMRPLCLHADDLTKCGGYGRVTCHDCLKAHADAEGISA